MKSNTDSAEALLAFALDTAKKYGATAADAMFVSGVSTEVKIRLGESENVKRSRSKGLGLRVFIGNRSATTSTSDLTHNAVEGLIQRTCEAASVLAPDEHAGLPAEQAFSETKIWTWIYSTTVYCPSMRTVRSIQPKPVKPLHLRPTLALQSPRERK